jgi:hypothetical protein
MERWFPTSQESNERYKLLASEEEGEEALLSPPRMINHQ